MVKQTKEYPMKFAHMLAFAAIFTLAACGDDSSSSTGPENSSDSKTPSSSTTSSSSDGTTAYDCTVADGVKVVYPKGGEKFKMGDTITVVYGAKIEDSGFCFKFKLDESDLGVDMLDGSAGPEVGDGKTCYKQEVVLTSDVAEVTETAIIRVHPYSRQNKGANSGTFQVTE